MQPKGNPSARKSPSPVGIDVRHSRDCPAAADADARCRCVPAYRAWVYDKRAERTDAAGNVVGHGRKERRTFTGRGALAEAKRWRANANSQLADGKTVGRSRITLREAAEAFLDGAEAEPPTVLNRSGQPYKPSVLRGYRHDLQEVVLPDLGSQRLSDVRRGDLQALVDRMLGQGLSGSKIRNVIVAVQALYRHSLERDEVTVNPTAHLRLPKGSGPRERAASASEAASLLAVLPADLRALYSTAAYAGLRRGELLALRWGDVDLAQGVIRVSRSWDPVAGEIEPKSEKGRRTVPITALLRDELTALKARDGRDGSNFVFGSTATTPFTPSHARKRALDAWKTANEERAKKAKERNQKPVLLVPIGLHELRHTYVSMMVDAGLSLERVGDYVGHGSAYMTDRYRHLLEGHEDEARRLQDAYLARADTASRVEQLEDGGKP